MPPPTHDGTARIPAPHAQLPTHLLIGVAPCPQPPRCAATSSPDVRVNTTADIPDAGASGCDDDHNETDEWSTAAGTGVHQDGAAVPGAGGLGSAFWDPRTLQGVLAAYLYYYRMRGVHRTIPSNAF